MIKLHILTVIVRSAFEKDGKYYLKFLSIFLLDYKC